MLNVMFFGNRHRFISRTIINNQHFDFVYTSDFLRNAFKNIRQGLLFVQARYLDN